MLIILTLIVTWFIKNWWKILLVIAAAIALREYQVYKYKKQNNTVYYLENKTGGSSDAGAYPGSGQGNDPGSYPGNDPGNGTGYPQ